MNTDNNQRGPDRAPPLRPLEAVEAAMHLLEDYAGVGHLVREVVLEGRHELDAFSRSLRRIRERYAPLRVAISNVEGRLAFIESETPIQVHPLEGGVSEEYLFESELNAPLPDGEVLRVTVGVEEESSRLRVLLSVHHAVMDGRSLNRVCTELIETYDDELRGRHSRHATINELGPPIEALLDPEWTSGGRFEEFLRRQAVALDTVPPIPIPGVKHDEHPRSGFCSASLTLRARPRGSRMVSVLGACLLRHARGLIPGEGRVPMAFAATVDVGSRLSPRPATAGLYISGVRTVVSVGGLSDESGYLADLLMRNLKEALGRGDAEFGVLAQRAAVEHHLNSGEAPAAVAVSYLGQVRRPSTESVRLVDLKGAVPMHGFGPMLYCHAAVLDQTLTCNLVFQKPSVKAEKARSILESALEEAARLLRDCSVAPSRSA